MKFEKTCFQKFSENNVESSMRKKISELFHKSSLRFDKCMDEFCKILSDRGVIPIDSYYCFIRGFVGSILSKNNFDTYRVMPNARERMYSEDMTTVDLAGRIGRKASYFILRVENDVEYWIVILSNTNGWFDILGVAIDLEQSVDTSLSMAIRLFEDGSVGIIAPRTMSNEIKEKISNSIAYCCLSPVTFLENIKRYGEDSSKILVFKKSKLRKKIDRVRSPDKKTALLELIDSMPSETIKIIGPKVIQLDKPESFLYNSNTGRKLTCQHDVDGHIRMQWVGSRSDGTWRQEPRQVSPHKKGIGLPERRKTYIVKDIDDVVQEVNK